MSLVCALLLCFSASWSHDPAASAGAQGMDHVIELARARVFPEALAAAEALPSPLERSQAKLFVLHNSGDLTGALRVGEEGLLNAPEDPWLLERVAYIAISLRAGDAAREYVDRLAARISAMSQLGEEDRARWQALLADYRAQTDALTTSTHDRATALSWAKWTVFLFLALSSVLWIVIARSLSQAVRGPDR